MHVVPPTLHGPRELTVESITETGKGTCSVRFLEIDSADAASQIAGRYLLARVEDCGLDAQEEPLYEIGRLVVDERYGDLGAIVELIETAANDVWVIDGPYGEVLVPIIEDVVIDIPESADEPIRTHVMDGIVDTRTEK